MPYRFQVAGIESDHDLMGSRFGRYGEMNTGFTGEDVRGFSRIFGNQTAIWHAVNNAHD
jgi:argininosuccinate synthase